MSARKDLVKNTIIIAVGRLSTQFLSFLLLPIYTAFLSPNDYGQLDLILIYISVLSPTITLEMEMAVFRHLLDVRGDRKKSGMAISSSLIVVLGGALIGILGVLVFGVIAHFELTGLALLLLLSTLFANYLLQVTRGIGRNDTYAVSSVVIGLTSVVLSMIFVIILHWSVAGILLAMAIGNTVGCIFMLLKNRLFLYMRYSYIDKKEIKELMVYAWPLVPNNIAIWGINGVSRTIVAAALSLAATGIYAAANKLTLIYTSLYGIFAMSWTESASLNLKKNSGFLSSATNSAIRMFSSLAVLIVSATSVLFPVLIGPKYADARNYIPILVIGAFFSSIMSHYGAIYVAAKKTTEVAKLTVQALIISSVLTVCGIRFIGLYAPAFALLVTYLYIAVRRHFDIQQYVRIRYDWQKLCGIMAIMGFVLLCYYSNNVYLGWLSVMVSTIGVTAINWGEVNGVVTFIKRKMGKRI